MKLLSEILEGIEDDHEVLIRFSNGNCFGIVDCEMVDESIYQRTDLCVGDIVSKIHIDRDVYKIGNKLEFSIDEIVEVKDARNNDIIWELNLP